MVETVNDNVTAAVFDASQIEELITVLNKSGLEAIGPVIRDDAVTYEPVSTAGDLPQGWHDNQAGGEYGLEYTDDERFFACGISPQSWKKYLFPPKQTLWDAKRKGKGFEIVKADESDVPQYAFLGVRPCELAAISIHDMVFDNGDFADAAYLARRKNALIIVVNCTRASGNCFCVSMGTGPAATGGYDLALTELGENGEHRFLVEAGSDRGAAIMAEMNTRPADETDIEAAGRAIDQVKNNMGRKMTKKARKALRKNLDHPRWDYVASRCLSCGNCTMVCPTCFCSTTRDLTGLDGQTAERQRIWDSCFTMDFSYIHGGTIRRKTGSRYRQWITHKLSYWHEQFGVSGCTGCGRCITWCPAKIDITEEARAIAGKAGKGE